MSAVSLPDSTKPSPQAANNSVNLVFNLLQTGASLEAIKTYLETIDINTKSNGYTLLSLGLQQKRYDVAKLLLEKGASLDLDMAAFDPLTLLAKADVDIKNLDFLALLSYILKKKPDFVNTQHYFGTNWSVLGLMIGNNLLDGLEEAIGRASPSTLHHKNGEEKFTALHIAAAKSNLNATQVLLQYGASIEAKDTYGNTPLHVAAHIGHHEIVSYLLIQKDNLPQADINAFNNINLTPLHLACFKGKLDAAKVLLQHGASIEAKDTYGNTPLHLAAQEDHYEIVSYLLIAKENLPRADVNACNNRTQTPLHLACYFGQLDTAKVLLQHRASIEAKNEDGDTPLHLAAQEGYHKVVSYLLIEKENLPCADVNACNNDNLTPLHCACQNGKLNAAKALLQHGASLDAKDTQGRTPIHIAEARRNHAFIMSLLENAYGNSK